MWFIYALMSAFLGFEAFSQYNKRPSKQLDQLYEEARRERLRKLGRQGDSQEYEY